MSPPEGVVVISDPPYGTGHYDTDADCGEFVRRLIVNYPCVLFGYHRLIHEWALAAGLSPREWLTWWPTNGALRSASRTALVARESEAIGIWAELKRSAKRIRTPEGAVLSRTNGHSVDLDSAVYGDVWTDAAPGLGFNSHLRQHPNEKPLAVLERLVLMTTDPGDIVFDPFMGSGTTGVAALKHGRRFIGAELNSEFFAVASSRLAHQWQQAPLFSEADYAR